MRASRLVVYGGLLVLLAGAGGYFWSQSVVVQVEWTVKRLRHPNARVASDAWEDLHQLYRTRWAAVEPVLAHATDSDPVSFLVESERFPVPGKAPREGFWAYGKPVYYKTDRIYCRTVGDAIRAILYNETDVHGRPRWRRDFEGDWDAWWQANKGYYGA